MRRKVSVIIGMLILIVGMGMNVQYALADYGIKENALPVMVLSQSGGGSGTSFIPEAGHQVREEIECSITIKYGETFSTKITTSGTRLSCQHNNYVEVCYNYDPCAGFYH